MYHSDPQNDFNQSFRQKLNKIKFISKEEEGQLLLDLKSDDKKVAEAARTRLTEAFLKFGLSMAMKKNFYTMHSAAASSEDFFQETVLGLQTAIDRYNPTIGGLSTYARWWIKDALYRTRRDNLNQVKTPRTRSFQHLDRFYRVTVAKCMEENPGWTAEQCFPLVAEKLNVTIDSIKAYVNMQIIGPVSMDTPLSEHREDSSTFGDLIEDTQTLSPEEYTDRVLSDELYKTEVQSALNALDERSRIVIQGRYMTDPKLTLEELGQQYGVSRERIRQLEQKALKELKKVFEKNRVKERFFENS